MEDNIDKKFVRTLFGFIAWLMYAVPMLYAIYSHEWMWFGFLIGAVVGVSISHALKQA